MFTLSYPWLLLLVFVPPLLRRMLPAYREPRQALSVPWFQRMADVLGQKPSDGAVVIQAKLLELLFLWLLWAILVVAIARPQYLEPPISRVIPTRDLMLLVDLSGSMETKDFTNAQGKTVDRLRAVKEVPDERVLETVASTTGGRYFYAADRDGLQQIYTELDRIDTRDVETATYRPRIDLFHWPLGVFLFVGFLYHVFL